MNKCMHAAMTCGDAPMQGQGARAAAGAAQLVGSPPAGGQPEWGVRAGQAAGKGLGGSAEGPALPPHPPASRHQVCLCMCCCLSAVASTPLVISSVHWAVRYVTRFFTKLSVLFSVPSSACCWLFVFCVNTCGDQQCVSSTCEGVCVWIIL